MSNQPEQMLPRQKRVLMIVGSALIVLGAIVLFGLRRLPVGIRMMTGLGDVFIGCVLLVLVRQQS